MVIPCYTKLFAWIIIDYARVYGVVNEMCRNVVPKSDQRNVRPL